MFSVISCQGSVVREDKPDSDIEYSDLSLFDDYRSEVKRWIEEQVTDPDFLSAPFRVVVMHIPPTGSTWHGTLDLATKYLPALNSAKIDIMLCGHTHNYKRHGVPVTFLLYPTGGHGFGNLNTFTYKHQFMQELATWLEGL